MKRIGRNGTPKPHFGSKASKSRRRISCGPSQGVKAPGSPASKKRLEAAKVKLKEFIMTREILHQNSYLQKYYEESEHARRLSAWFIKKRHNNMVIKAIFDEANNCVVNQPADINRVFLTHYENVYTSTSGVVPDRINAFLDSAQLPTVTNDKRVRAEAPIILAEVTSAISNSMNKIA
ncbi:hypothetical protein NDU88_007555 [Pleurodeles waltl]|uniref:Uncharacterized protein n=1 Tax=Pleurodeles waltl TaxID=8319 RepID=A0AAV7NV65_PLEWA|nr:hypothetical protein NDU88_007555 [Pleurodeles waltl]